MIIGICDDKKIYRDHIRKICEHTKEEFIENWDIIEFTDGMEILNSSIPIDILILDLEMPVINGIQVKDMLQNKKIDTTIIYVTSHSEYMQEAFGIHVLGFVKKESMDFQLPKILKQALSMYQKAVMIEGKYNSKEICFIKVSHIYCDIHMVDSTVKSIRTSLKKLEKILQPVGFIKTERAYLVNLDWVESIKKQTVVMKEKKGEVPLSYRKRNEIKKCYMEYCKTQGRYY